MVKISECKWLFSSLFLGCISLSMPSFCAEQAKKIPPKVEYYKNDTVTNQIPYFDNRFRIDAQIEELTLLFYRKSGSKPVILIQPDGSKLKVDSVDKEQIEWFDDATFDMIRIKKPMPGPWQAVGDILPNSKIMVVSDVKLQVEPLPQIVLSGETLKITGQLFNGDKAIDNPLFRSVIKLDVDFYSTNNSAYDNFGADAIKISSFRDDGHDLDEYSGDNIFTGEFELDFAPGEWQPVYLVKLPMATREIKQPPIILQKTPVTISVDLAEKEGDFHQVHFTIDKEFVDVDSLVFQGKTRFPDKQSKPFTIMDTKGDIRTIKVEYTEPGIYRINTRAFGETINGREFRLSVDEFSFNVKASDVVDVMEGNDEVDINNEELNDNPVKINPEEVLAEKMAESQKLFKEKEDLKLQETIIAIVVTNISIIIVVIFGIVLFRWRQTKNEK